MQLRPKTSCILFPRCMITLLVVSITKFLIVIGSTGAYLSLNRLVITWVSNDRCPMTGVQFERFAIGYPRDLHVNCVRFDGFLRNVFYSFQNSGKSRSDVFAQKKFIEDIFNSEIWYRYD